ncbi:MAG: multiheme c-type cytochrome [candidate division KSB1 bacterium]|nr:multiheme c-type cytochrome [candidate division KSB1 bacterium]MDZ7365206.1 multiheme c-type cytochrome [candidate division KSB1 bacterium]MDZ7406952.1 multiheme c-type cytochrome [candidate division KSB1 bacterium]
MRKKKIIQKGVFAVITTLGPALSPCFAQYKTLGPGSCGLGQSNCHTNENNWWKDDAHHATVDAFYDDPAAYEKIAQLAGVGTGNMLKGNQICASCHGTVIAGKESRDVEDGVSCESCHGPGSDYKDPHSEKPGGYEKALKLGLVELKNLDTRAKTCVRCHYITDQKLIAAGHPNGANFNYISGMKKVARHWKRQATGEDLTKVPFENAMRVKGPVAQIAKVEPAVAPMSRPPVKREAISPAETRQPARPTASVVAAPSQNPVPSRPTPTAAIMPVDNAAPLDLPPFPNISDTTSVRDILLIVKKRLELLYQKTNGNTVNSP